MLRVFGTTKSLDPHITSIWDEQVPRHAGQTDKGLLRPRHQRAKQPTPLSAAPGASASRGHANAGAGAYSPAGNPVAAIRGDVAPSPTLGRRVPLRIQHI